MNTAPLHLWEADHPYYAQEGNYYARPDQGLHVSYSSWQEFFADMGDADPDMNLVYRWDWHREGFFDWEGDDLLQVFWMGQRKALCRSSDVMVHTDDEPAVRAWLEDRARTLVAMWSPLSLVASSPVGGEHVS